MNVEIPKFKGTNDAVAFGEKHQGNFEVLQSLEYNLNETKQAFYALDRKIDADTNELLQLSFIQQFYREAIEAYKGIHPRQARLAIKLAQNLDSI